MGEARTTMGELSTTVITMPPRERTIKLTEQEYQQLRKAQKELEDRKRAEMEEFEPEDPDTEEGPSVDWGSVALGAVAALGAAALLVWLKNKAQQGQQQNQQQGNQW